MRFILLFIIKRSTLCLIIKFYMKIRTIYLFACLLLCQMGLAQQTLFLHPYPQEMKQSGEVLTLPMSFQFIGGETANSYAVRKLKKLLGEEQNAVADFKVYIGKKGDKAIRKYAGRIPDYPEAYYLLVNRKEIVLAGNDERGTFYAVQTLAGLLKDGKLPGVEIKDYPTIRFRGVVEGFYGTPWSHQARLRQLEFYGENKLNTYIYGPKDDPYHSCPNWRKPYPEGEAKQIGELVGVAKANAVDFVWAIHPGQDIRWNETDRNLLLEKFESMYQLGVRSFAVFFDDISGEGTDPLRQAELLNYIDDHFVRVKGDVTPLIMCPTEYNKSWSDPAKGYLATLGTKLNPSIQIMWTGDRVISDITEDGLRWVNEKIKRPAYVWWNFPVSDYVRDHLLMGAVYGLDPHIGKQMSGFVTNPMEHAEASKLAIYSVADYAWNLEKFDSEKSWKEAVCALLPKDAEALQVFVDHNSDLGPNGHGYRRDESVDVQPVAARFLKDYRQGKYAPEDFSVLWNEFDKIEESADILLVNTENADLIREITPWLYRFKLLGEAGKEALSMMKSEDAASEDLFMRKYKHVRALQQLIFRLDQTYNRNPYQPGIKTGSKIMQPLADTIFMLATRAYNQRFGTRLSDDIFTSPHKIYTSVGQFRGLPVWVKNNQVVLSPILEVVKWGSGEFLGIEMDQAYAVEDVTADFGIKNPDWLQAEISTDGQDWTALSFTQNGNQLKTACGNKQARFIRFRNQSGKEQEVYLRKFIVTLKK